MIHDKVDDDNEDNDDDNYDDDDEDDNVGYGDDNDAIKLRGHG